MSQRDSGYERIELDQYMTPPWVTEALLPHLPKKKLKIWECACGTGQMADVLKQAGHNVYATDISHRPSTVDFLVVRNISMDAIVTNPPYTHAEEFIEHALDLMSKKSGLVAMLLRTDFDHAKRRQYLFADNKAFSKKLVLTKRIQWFEHSTSAPSFNHAWFIFDHRHKGPPVIAYGPKT